MPVFDNLNYSYSQGVAVGVTQYFERTLLENLNAGRRAAREAGREQRPENAGEGAGNIEDME